MFTDYLQPVAKELQDFAKSCNSFCIGASVNFDDKILYNEELKKQDKIAIIGVQEFRSKNSDEQDDTNFDLLRRSFYELKNGNWHLSIYDFGDLISIGKKEEIGETLSKVLADLIRNNYLVIILGGSPSLGFYQYRAYDNVVKNVNYFTVDEKISLGNEIHQPNDDNYLTKIIVSEPLNLKDFTNLGYQTYFVAQEELDLLEELNFEAVRLGIINQDIKEVEHYVREANAGLINLSAIDSYCFNSSKYLTPNGFNSREICAVAKYIGSSNVLSSIYLSNYFEKYLKVDHLLICQVIWYLIDGRNHRIDSKNIKSEDCFEKYFVQSDINDFTFYRNIYTNQWWVEVNDNDDIRLVPCSENDYLKAQSGEVPMKWWKFFKKNY